MAVSIDYVGNRGKDNTSVIDINEGPVNAAGRVTRLGVNVFDPAGAFVPAAARNSTFVQFNQEQTKELGSANFLIPIVADNPRTAQLGVRLTS
jgi:hypothetical protein